jgi:transcriptional regulator with XRE-family HTH domain
MVQVKEMTAAERMARARLFVGLDQHEMAELLGKNRNTISAWERGVNEPPLSALAKWALVTGRSIDWIVWGDSGRPSESGLNAEMAPSGEDEANSVALVRPKGFEPPTF